MDTNGFKAEFGHAGGGVMNFVSKSGTNAFHGSAYEFLRNNALDANNFFNNRAGIAIPVYKQHDFGASRGRPGLDSENLQREEQDLLLLLVRSLPQSRGRHWLLADHSDARNVHRRFQQLGGPQQQA